MTLNAQMGITVASPNTVASGYTRTTESIVAVDRERQELYANRGVLCGVSRV